MAKQAAKSSIISNHSSSSSNNNNHNHNHNHNHHHNHNNRSSKNKNTLEPGQDQNRAGQEQQQHEATSGPRLKRSLGALDGAGIIVGVIVGSGIFVAPRGVLAGAGSIGASLVVWALAGLLALLGAMCFAELGASVPNSGGDYTYIGMAYGPLASFLYLWVMVLVVLPCSNAIAALTFANYVLQPLQPEPTLEGPTSGGGGGGPQAGLAAGDTCASWPPPGAVRLLAMAMLLLLTYLNCVSVRASIRLQSGLTLAKVVALGGVVGLGAWTLARTGTSLDLEGRPRPGLWEGTVTDWYPLVQAFYASFYTYAGWNSLNFVTEEMREPARNMPRAIVLSLASVTLLYLLVNVAYFGVLSRAEVLESEAIAVSFGLRTLPRYLDQTVMPVSVALSTVSGLNGGLFAASRILFAASRQGQLVSSLHLLHPDRLTPVPAVLLLGALSLCYLCTTEVLRLINYMVFVEAILAALAVSTVLTLRAKLPALERPLRVQAWIPLAYLIFSLGLILVPIWAAPGEAAVGLGLLAAGLPVYGLTASWHNKPAGYRRALDALNLIVQKLTWSVAPAAGAPIEGAQPIPAPTV